MNWTKINNYIFDVDGTLYSQKKVRLKMLLRLITYYGLRLYRLKELYALYKFRKLREQPEYKETSMHDLYIIISKKCNLSSGAIQKIIEKWMFIEPLELLKKYKYKDVIAFINKHHQLGKKIIIYSDYPAAEKLNVMQINYDKLYVSGENGFKEQKPSLKAMQNILKSAIIDPSQTVYIGDRDDRDKISAEYVNITYYDIQHFRKIID